MSLSYSFCDVGWQELILQVEKLRLREMKVVIEVPNLGLSAFSTRLYVLLYLVS